jgi:energy-coupling factor transporter ATP-binding protein EcfA2/uncharacterized protein (DUF697 family)
MLVNCATQKEWGSAWDIGRPTIAVIGKRGVGKSTLINSLRGISPKDPHACKVGANEVVTKEQKQMMEKGLLCEASPYHHQGMVFIDVPGCEGKKVPSKMGKEYIEKFKLDRADGIIFVYTDVMEKRMVDCAKSLKEHYLMPVHIVRNKAKLCCENDVRDGNAEDLDEAFKTLEATAVEELTDQGGQTFVDEDLFLVEAAFQDAVEMPADPIHQWQIQFVELKKSIVSKMKDKAKAHQVDAIFRRNLVQLAQDRADLCREICPKYAMMAALYGANPVPGVGCVGFTGVGYQMAQEFCTTFGFDSTMSDDPKVTSFVRQVVVPLVVSRIGSMMAACAAADAAADFLQFTVPVAGVLVNVVFGASLGGVGVMVASNRTIPKMQKLAFQVYDHAIKKDGGQEKNLATIEELFPPVPPPDEPNECDACS